jgi:putative phosphoesterase
MMKGGILSDSHDQRGFAEDALVLFREEGVQVILHLGDVCSPETIGAYRECGIPMIGVYGNNDVDKEGLQAVSGNGFHQGPYMPEIAGRKVLMAHSFDELQEEIGEGGRFDLILFGHTHRPLTMRIGRALILNPGEACGFVSGKATCCVIDFEKMEASIREILPGAANGRNLSGDSPRQRRVR